MLFRVLRRSSLESLNPPQKITCGFQASMSFCESSVRCQEKRLPQRPDLLCKMTPNLTGEKGVEFSFMSKILPTKFPIQGEPGLGMTVPELRKVGCGNDEELQIVVPVTLRHWNLNVKSLQS